MLRNPPPYGSPLGRLGPCPTRQSTGLAPFTGTLFGDLTRFAKQISGRSYVKTPQLQLAGVDGSSSILFSFIDTKKPPFWTVFHVLVEMRRIELLSESISTGFSPSAAGGLDFASLPAHQQAGRDAIP